MFYCVGVWSIIHDKGWQINYKLFCLLNMASMVANNVGCDEITHSVAFIWVNIFTLISK